MRKKTHQPERFITCERQMGGDSMEIKAAGEDRPETKLGSQVIRSGYVVMARGTQRGHQAPSKRGQVTRSQRAKCRGSAPGPEAPRAGPRVKVWGNLAFEDALT